MDVNYVYSKLRSSFGRQPMFSEQGPELCDNIAVDPEEQKNYILRNPVHTSTQYTPRFSQCEINTIRAVLASTGINHAEGGWPRDVNVNDPEATQRYRRKIEKDDGYIHCVMDLCPGMERLVMQNNAIDMYQTYYAELGRMAPVIRSTCRTVNVFRDLGPDGNANTSGTNRPINSICWQPEGGQKFAATYVDLDFNRETRSPIVAYIWDVENANYPDKTITPPCPMLDLVYNPKDINVMAGGLLNGQVATWDLRKSTNQPELICPLHVAHRDYVRNVLFNNSKTGMEFFSAGPDGACKWWDMRKFDEPTDVMIIDIVNSINDEPSMAHSFGVSYLEFEPTIPTRFIVGTENGLVIIGNRKGKTPVDKLPAKFNAHLGPVWRVERNPGFLKNFLTVGDWTARVWSEDCRESAILWTPLSRNRITDGAWSPTKYSLMQLTHWDGRVTIWDLLRRAHEPILNIQVCEEPLLKVRPHDSGSLLACGSNRGNIYLLELSPTLVHPELNDKALLTAVFERESRRERILEARLREIRLRHRQAEEVTSPTQSTMRIDMTIGDRDLYEAAQDYMATAKKELAAL